VNCSLCCNVSTPTNDTNNTDPCFQAISGQYDQGLHIMAIFLVLLSSWLGCSLPIVLIRFPNAIFMQRLMYCCRFFGAGVILSTGFVHIFPAAVQALSDPCLPEWFSQSYTAAAGLFSMLAVLAMHLFEWLAVTHTQKMHKKEKENELDEVPQKDVNTGHSHGLLLEQKTQRISTYTLELGVSIHSVIIGVALGVSIEEFIPFMIAIIFHQLFEGMGLGAMIAELQFERHSFLYMTISVLLYSITTPVGVAIGIGITSRGWEATEQLLVTGILDSISAGILIYTALMSLLGPIFRSPKFYALSVWDRLLCFVAFYAGAGVMSALAIWA